MRRFGALQLVVVAVVYFAAASLSLRLAFEKTNASPVWPPSGIALAAVLLLGYRAWPGIMLGAVAANIAAFLSNHVDGIWTVALVSTAIGIGNTLEALVGRFVIHRWIGAGTTAFNRAQDVFKFTAVAPLACVASASVGPTVVTLAGMAPSAGYATIWFTWWLGDVTGVLLVTPLLLTWATGRAPRWTFRGWLEAALLFTSLLVATHVASGGWLLDKEARYPLTFVCLPWLVWSAFRFGPREAATAAAVTSGIAVWDTVHGLGPFVRATINESLLLLQAFVSVVTVTILTMAAVVAERRDDRDNLGIRVGERTRELEVLADLVQTINAALEPDAVLQRLVDGARELARSDMAGVMLRETGSAAVVARYIVGHRPEAGWTRIVEPGRGVGGQVLMTGVPWRTDDYVADTRITKDYVEWARAEGLVALIVVPILINQRVQGLLYLGNRSARPFTDQDESILVRLAQHAALAIHNARLLREAEHRRHTAESLAEVGRRISESLDPRAVAHSIAESLRALLGVPVVFVYRLEPDSRQLVAIGLLGDVGPDFTENLTFSVGVGGVGRAVLEGRVITSANVLEDPEIQLTPDLRHGIEQAGYRAVLAVPLRIQDTIIGALGLGDRAGRIFEAEEIDLVQAFADQAAIALHNARLYEQGQQAYAELSETQAQLVQTRKMEAIGRLAAGVAHDFNNLLTIIRGRGQLVLKRLPAAHPTRHDLELIQKTCDRASRVVEQLLAFSRKQVLQPKILDLNTVVGAMIDMLRRLIGEDIELTFVPATELGRVRVDLGQLEQVIVNLAVNARDAMPDGGRLTLETANVDLDDACANGHNGVRPGRYVRLSVSDSGIGMDEQSKNRIFEPFFTTKEVGKGTGLGLATVCAIVEQNGGMIAVYSEVGHGTTFKIYLPLVDESPDTTATHPEGEARGGTETVLLVEDEDDVRTLAREMLESLGYAVLEARQPREAMLVAEQRPGPIHLMLTDVVMPELNGPRLAERVTSRRPEMKVLYMSGYTDGAIVHHGVLERGKSFMHKPFSRETLAEKVREVLDGAAAR